MTQMVDVDVEDRLAESRRDRANESLNQLHETFSRKPVPGTTTSTRRPVSGTSTGGSFRGHQRAHSWSERGSHRGPVPEGTHDYSYRSAANRLRGLLQNAERIGHPPPSGVHFSPPRWSEYPLDNLAVPRPDAAQRDLLRGNAGHPGELPSAEELYALVQHQGAYITHLELENKYCKEELTSLKSKLHELTNDNKRLHAELKRAICHDVLHGDGDDEGEPRPPVPSQLLADPKFQRVKNSPEFISRSIMLQKWQKETDRISALHQSKTARLETQLKQARDDLAAMERENERLKSTIRMAESVSISSYRNANVLCAVCCTNEAVLPSQQASLSKAVDRLTSERDELVESLAALKVKLDMMQQRETEAYDQVKSSIILVEEAQLEKTEALVQREQIGDELEKLRSRFEEHIQEFQEKIDLERQLVRQEFRKEIDDCNAKLKELNESLASAQHRLERSHREKTALENEYGKVKSQLSLYEQELGQTTNNMKYQLAKAQIDKNMAVQALQKLRADLDKRDREHDQERLKYKTEVDDLKRRLNSAERELMESKDECIYLTSNLQVLERDVHIAKISKESLERGRSDDFKLLHQRHQQREAELNSFIDKLQIKYDHVQAELEEMVGKQNALVHKLKDECSNLTKKLEHVSHKKRKEVKYLKAQVEELSHRLRKSKEKIRDMEDTDLERGHFSEKMKNQIKNLEFNLQQNSHQIMELLAAKSDLLNDREMLSKEVGYLRHQLTTTGTNISDFDKFIANQKLQEELVS